jgi:hypothetical protein
MFKWAKILSFMTGLYLLARYDKYEPYAGGFRARLAADWVAADGTPVAVGLDANGRVVPGGGTSGIVGIVVLVADSKKAGDVVDVMTHGEIVEVGDTGFTGRAAGIAVYAVIASGALTNVATANVKVGHMVEATRLVVRKGAAAGTGA